jgi:hypothetical protein
MINISTLPTMIQFVSDAQTATKECGESQKREELLQLVCGMPPSGQNIALFDCAVAGVESVRRAGSQAFAMNMSGETHNPRLKTDVESARLSGSLIRHGLAALR